MDTYFATWFFVYHIPTKQYVAAFSWKTVASKWIEKQEFPNDFSIEIKDMKFYGEQGIV